MRSRSHHPHSHLTVTDDSLTIVEIEIEKKFPRKCKIRLDFLRSQISKKSICGGHFKFQ